MNIRFELAERNTYDAQYTQLPKHTANLHILPESRHEGNNTNSLGSQPGPNQKQEMNNTSSENPCNLTYKHSIDPQPPSSAVTLISDMTQRILVDSRIRARA